MNASLGFCQGKESDQQSLLRNVLETCEAGNLILGDAFFGIWFLWAALDAFTLHRDWIVMIIDGLPFD